MESMDQSLELPDERHQRFHRRNRSTRTLDHGAISSEQIYQPNENTSLLSGEGHATGRSYRGTAESGRATPRPQRQHSYHTNTRFTRNHSRNPSRNHSRRGSLHFSQRLVNALGAENSRAAQALDSSIHTSKHSFFVNDRVWYDQFTSTDWVHDQIADAYRVKALHSEKGLRGKLHILFDAVQGWLLVALIGIITATLAYFVNVTEAVLFDYKEGFCSEAWYRSRKKCCSGATQCEAWNNWSQVFNSRHLDNVSMDYVGFGIGVLVLSLLSFTLTLTTKTVIPSAISMSTLDEDLAADTAIHSSHDDVKPATQQVRPPMVYYSAAGSGVAEIKVIVSGFVLHGYLGLKVLVVKTIALILSVASGLTVGKEGPYVHIATCIGNITCRFFLKYRDNDMKRREALSAAAASGVAVAFGAPIAGVLFSLEEVSYYFPPKTLFRTFFCSIVAALSLKFLNPYGTNKIVLFEVRYLTDWYFFEMAAFILLGFLGGALGALFIKATRIWAQSFRRIPTIRKHPILEVLLVAITTGLVTFWNRYTKLPVTELLLELASPCSTYTQHGYGLCPDRDNIPTVMGYLLVAFVIKAVLTTITFGIKVPAGIYVPSMVVGGLLGRFVGHGVQYLALTYGHSGLFGKCSADSAPEDCVVPGVYALVAAGATMCGVTRLTVTLAVILFELTGSLDHVLPFSVGVLVAKWTSDFMEPRSIYDLLTDMNSYPFLDNKHRPMFTADLGQLLPRSVRQSRIIDITDSPLVPATELRGKLEELQEAGELDGGIPILRRDVLVGLIPAPDLEFALDKLENEGNSFCLMATDIQWLGNNDDGEDGGDGAATSDPTDFTQYIDPAPVALDSHSPLDLVYECFVKLGLRYVCALKDGKYAGMVHKKAFVKYCKDLGAHNKT